MLVVPAYSSLINIPVYCGFILSAAEMSELAVRPVDKSRIEAIAEKLNGFIQLPPLRQLIATYAVPPPSGVITLCGGGYTNEPDEAVINPRDISMEIALSMTASLDGRSLVWIENRTRVIRSYSLETSQSALSVPFSQLPFPLS